MAFVYRPRESFLHKVVTRIRVGFATLAGKQASRINIAAAQASRSRSIMKKHIIITASLGKLKLPLTLINKEKALQEEIPHCQGCLGGK